MNMFLLEPLTRFLPILIGFKSFYLLSTPCRIILLELHSFTTYISASRLFKMQFLNSCVENVTQLLAINQVKKVFWKVFSWCNISDICIFSMLVQISSLTLMCPIIDTFCQTIDISRF